MRAKASGDIGEQVVAAAQMSETDPGFEPAAGPCFVDGFTVLAEKFPVRVCRELKPDTPRFRAFVRAGIGVFDTGISKMPCIFPGFRESGAYEQRRRVRSRLPAPPVSPVGTFFSRRSAPAGTARNAGLRGHSSEPRGRAPRPFWAISCLSSAPFSDATEPRPFWYGCEKLDSSMSYKTPETVWV